MERNKRLNKELPTRSVVFIGARDIKFVDDLDASCERTDNSQIRNGPTTRDEHGPDATGGVWVLHRLLGRAGCSATG